MARKDILKSTAFAELTSCKCWPVAEARLREGASPKAVAEYIQSMGERTNIKLESLRRQLQRYKKRVLRPRQALSPTYIDQMIASMDANIDDVEELTKVILVQKERVAKDLKLEQSMPKLAPWLTKEVSLLFDMIERRARLLQNLGILYKAPDKHLVAVVGDETWSRLLDTLEPEQRTKAREIVQTEYAMIREGQAAAGQARRSGLQSTAEKDDGRDF